MNVARSLCGIGLFSCLFGALPGQKIVRGPYLQSGTDKSIVIRWRTDDSTDSRVDFGTALGSLKTSVKSSKFTREHEVRLTGLTADTRYFYSIRDHRGVLAGGASYFFLTSPRPGHSKSTRIWVLGDSGTANVDAQAVRDGYYAFTGARHTDLWLMLGDNAYLSGTDPEYQKAVFEMYPKMLRKSVLWPTFGNHEGYSSNAVLQLGPYFEMFTLPKKAEAGGVASGTESYYSFDYGNIHFVCLESYVTSRSSIGAMMTWLKQDLAMNTREWLIAYWHHPPYSKGTHDSDIERELIEMRESALPILEKAGVDLVLSGHSHSYERTPLIDGHYGKSDTFGRKFLIDDGDGKPRGDGSYRKPKGIHNGAVYVVAGCSGYVSAGSLDHKAMFMSMAKLGSLVLDVNGPRLDVKFLDIRGKYAAHDQFTILKGPAASTARFAADVRKGPPPLAVQFTDRSTVKPTSWLWDFGDGTTSTSRNPTHTYKKEGLYTVTLKATNTHGSDTLVRKDLVHVRNLFKGEGLWLSKDKVFRSRDRTFHTADTIHMRVWTDRVDFDNLEVAEMEFRDPSGNRIRVPLTNHRNNSYTASFPARLLPSASKSWTCIAIVRDWTGDPFQKSTPVIILPPPPNVVLKNG